MATMTIDELRRIVDSARASGISTRSVADIMAEAKKRAAEAERVERHPRS